MLKIIGQINPYSAYQLHSALPNPDTWPITEVEKRNKAIRETRGMVFRFQDKDRPRDDIPIQDTPNRLKYSEIEPFLLYVTTFGYGSDLGRVRINYLPADGKINLHRDVGKYFEEHTRFLIPLKTNSDVTLTVDGVEYNPQVGNVYLFDNNKPHEAFNGGDEGRLHLIIDVK